MEKIDRRRFLSLAGGTVAASMLSDSIAHAASIPANRRTGSIKDVEHIVILMQENRSFDHYFGTLRGVRGFGDPHPATQPSGKSVWHQYDPDQSADVLPFRPHVGGDLSEYFVEDLDHTWYWTHFALNGGAWDQWIPSKGTTAMAHYRRADAAFHYALADAFTVCDNYFCSLLGPTDPNRSYMWTGSVGFGAHDPNAPMISNSEPDSGPGHTTDDGFRWTTYPERLEAAGVSWKIYQDTGLGLDSDHYFGWGPSYIGNYGDNTLLYFRRYNAATPGSPLYDKARTGTTITSSGGDVADAAAGDGLFEILRQDVKDGRLPQVSWVTAPESYTEHPQWPSGYGAWYISKVLDALTSNPEVWSKTALILTYDENDGFFDHVVSPIASVPGISGRSTVSVTEEYCDGTVGGVPTDVAGAFGLGVRVPTVVVSPWSTGGYVNSELFDHTSLIRFIEARFGVHEPNISPWRRAVSGDLTSAFNFAKNASKTPKLPSTAAYQPTGSDNGYDHPTPPLSGNLPGQEPGLRPARRLGYNVGADVTLAAGTLKLALHNAGSLGAHIWARSLTIPGAPFSYTLGKGRTIRDKWAVEGVYDLELHGPNGFYRQYAGSPTSPLAVVLRQVSSDDVEFEVTLAPGHAKAVPVTIDDAYGRKRPDTIRAGRGTRYRFSTSRTGGWYDVTFTSSDDADFAVTAAGQLESCAVLTSDPQFGRGPRTGWVRPWAPTPLVTRTVTAPPPPQPHGHGKKAQQLGPQR
ncbi:MAG: phosphocholine-specific phospholipase C [Actinomycetales bacterium]